MDDERVELHMRDSDAFSWYMEADPLLRSTVCAVMELERCPDWDTVVERIDRASRLAPCWRHKVVLPPARLATPRWVVDPDFDLSWHVRRVTAAEPADLGWVLDFARQTAMSGFDRARPLWEYTLIDGLEGGRAALVCKVHHALTDGVGGMEVAKFLFDLEPDPGDLGPMPPAPEGTEHDTAELVRESLAYDWSRLFDFSKRLLGSAPGEVAHALRHPFETAREAADTARSVARMVQPVTDTLSPIMTERRLQWHYDLLEMAFADLRAATRVAGCSLNAGFLGGMTGGLRHYHERFGAEVEALRLTMPISTRTADDPVGGNRITLQRFTVPMGIVDPVERMRSLQTLSDHARDEPAIPLTNAIAGTMNLLPSSVVGGMLKHIDFLASNVPGIPRPIYLAGVEVQRFCGFGPTIGAALNATLVSYNGRCHVAVTTDAGAVPDPGVMVECLVEGFEEVLDVAGDHGGVTVPTA